MCDHLWSKKRFIRITLGKCFIWFYMNDIFGFFTVHSFWVSDRTLKIPFYEINVLSGHFCSQLMESLLSENETMKRKASLQFLIHNLLLLSNETLSRKIAPFIQDCNQTLACFVQLLLRLTIHVFHSIYSMAYL